MDGVRIAAPRLLAKMCRKCAGTTYELLHTSFASGRGAEMDESAIYIYYPRSCVAKGGGSVTPPFRFRQTF
jgi:hypothetical protein